MYIHIVLKSFLFCLRHQGNINPPKRMTEGPGSPPAPGSVTAHIQGWMSQRPFAGDGSRGNRGCSPSASAECNVCSRSEGSSLAGSTSEKTTSASGEDDAAKGAIIAVEEPAVAEAAPGPVDAVASAAQGSGGDHGDSGPPQIRGEEAGRDEDDEGNASIGSSPLRKRLRSNGSMSESAKDGRPCVKIDPIVLSSTSSQDRNGLISSDRPCSTRVVDITVPDSESSDEEPEVIKPRLERKREDVACSDDYRAAAESRCEAGIPDPIIPTKVPPLRSSPFSNAGPRWTTYKNALLVRIAPTTRKPVSQSSSLPTKAACFDMDGTLLVWRCPGYPSLLSHYELWSASTVDRLRHLHDSGHMLVIFSNQGSIRSAVNGKAAARVRSVIDWIAHIVDRPLNAAVSCGRAFGHHKPSPNMWTVAEQKFNQGRKFDLASSFYVGDSASLGEGGESTDPDDPQGGVDRRFAENVGVMLGGTLKFFTPDQYLGASDSEKRKVARAAELDARDYKPTPSEALNLRGALSGGYLSGPVLLILVGVQGCGKSTFCDAVVNGGEGGIKANEWVSLSQDTIRNGKPGKRQDVEDAAKEQLESNPPKSVIIDRMHLTPDQRAHFIDIARCVGVPAHVVWLDLPRSVVDQRLKNRTRHVGGVEGEKGVRLAISSFNTLSTPKYDEGISLISRARSDSEMTSLAAAYRRVSSNPMNENVGELSIPLDFSLETKCGQQTISVAVPSVALGTMGMKKHETAQLVQSGLLAGIRAFDTAPTYENENEVGQALRQSSVENPFLIIKVPKKATRAKEARREVAASLRRLGRTKADLILLHWPCDLIEADTLGSVWRELEGMVAEGYAAALGVSNFSVGALRMLLPLCRKMYPVVNQIERHCLNPQWNLVDYCTNHGILLQAHTPLGSGASRLLGHPLICDIAKSLSLQVPEMLLRWNLSHGVSIVTKCSSKHRQEAAANLTKCLPPSVMKALDSIGQNAESIRFVDPAFMHRKGAVYSW